MVAGLFSGVLAAVLVRGLAGSPTAIALVPGVHHEGVAISATHPLLQAPPSAGPEVERLTLKQGCAWAQPGRSPYRGDVEQALVTARLPAEVVHRIALKVRSGQPDDRLLISNAAIRSERDAREFDARNFRADLRTHTVRELARQLQARPQRTRQPVRSNRPAGSVALGDGARRVR
jgi:hypothetical protein